MMKYPAHTVEDAKKVFNEAPLLCIGKCTNTMFFTQGNRNYWIPADLSPMNGHVSTVFINRLDGTLFASYNRTYDEGSRCNGSPTPNDEVYFFWSYASFCAGVANEILQHVYIGESFTNEYQLGDGKYEMLTNHPDWEKISAEMKEEYGEEGFKLEKHKSEKGYFVFTFDPKIS